MNTTNNHNKYNCCYVGLFLNRENKNCPVFNYVIKNNIMSDYTRAFKQRNDTLQKFNYNLNVYFGSFMYVFNDKNEIIDTLFYLYKNPVISKIDNKIINDNLIDRKTTQEEFCNCNFFKYLEYYSINELYNDKLFKVEKVIEYSTLNKKNYYHNWSVAVKSSPNSKLQYLNKKIYEISGNSIDDFDNANLIKQKNINVNDLFKNNFKIVNDINDKTNKIKSELCC